MARSTTQHSTAEHTVLAAAAAPALQVSQHLLRDAAIDAFHVAHHLKREAYQTVLVVITLQYSTVQ